MSISYFKYNKLKASRIIVNTITLYLKLGFVLVLSLITLRLVLNALGQEDYGLFNLVAGTVGAIGILRISMSDTSARYLGYYQGKGDKESLKNVFESSVLLHISIGFFLLVLIEAIGLWLFSNVFEIPGDRLSAAKLVFHCMTGSLFLTILAVPFDSLLYSRENIFVLSLFDALAATMKFGVAILINFTSESGLVIYGFSFVLIQGLLFLLKMVYCSRRYKEFTILRVTISPHTKILSEMFSFSGWNLLGSLSSIAVKEVNGVLLNIFFGLRLNAANGVSKQVGNQLNMISSSLTKAINPQMNISEGIGNRSRVRELLSASTKFTIFVYSLAAVPLFVHMPKILELWLKDVPEMTLAFTRLVLINGVIQKFSFELTNALRAVGKIKEFQTVETIIALSNIPLSYFLLDYGFDGYVVYLVGALLSSIMFFERIYFSKKIFNLDIKEFVKNAVTWPCVVLLTYTFMIGLMYYLTANVFTLIISGMLSAIIAVIMFYYTNLTIRERVVIYEFTNKALTKLNRLKN